jgi:hypothetical protein
MPDTQLSSTSDAADEPTQDVKEAEVKVIAGQDSAADDLSGVAFSYRHHWGNWNGQRIYNLTWNAINRDSRIFVATSEGNPGEAKFIGDARYTVHNVAPYDGGVRVRINIEYDAPIGLSIDYLVVNP